MHHKYLEQVMIWGLFSVLSFMAPEIKVNTAWDAITLSVIPGAHLAPKSQREEQKAEILVVL